MEKTRIGTSGHTTVAAFGAASQIIGSDRVNTPVTDRQRVWLAETYDPGLAELERIKEIASNATRDAANHIDFLRKHGWQAQITACPPDGFLTAAVLDVLVHWSAPGTRTQLNIDGLGQFPAAKLSDVELRRHKASGTIVAMLPTKTGEEVLIGMAEHAPTDLLQLDRMTDELFGGAHEPHWRNQGLIFPMVDLASTQKLDWLEGLQTCPRGLPDQTFYIAEAVQQATLKMNHEGARARAAVEMGMRSASVPPPPFQIDRPFFVAIRRPSVTKPLFTAYVGHDAWKDPGGLGI